MYLVTWDSVQAQTTSPRARLRNAAVFAVWFVFGRRFADRLSRAS